MFERRFSDGDHIYGQGDPGDAVYLVISGTVHLRREEESEPVRVVRRGEAFGRSGILRGRARQYSAIANGDVTVRLIRRIDVLDQLEKTPDLWFPAVLQALLQNPDEAQAPALDIETFVPPQEKVTVPKERIVLLAAGDRTASHIDDEGIPIARLPFRVGRVTKRRDKPVVDIDLALRDSEPFMLSRRHFVIDAAADRKYVVRDDGSHNGTIVNGQRLGREGSGRTAVLREGENEIIAGTERSEFRFLLRIAAP